MTEHNAVYVGCDLGDKFTEWCVIDSDGAIVESRRTRTTRHAVETCLSKYKNAVVVVEAGVHAQWVERVVVAAGHRVVVANPRKVRLIWARGHKTDRGDAEMLARLGRVDLKLLAPVQHRAYPAQVDLASLRSRDLLVRTRTKLVTHVRGVVKPFGTRLAACTTEAFPDVVEEAIPPELLSALAPVLRVIRELTTQIAAHDKQIEQLAASYPQTARFREVDGVGVITAVAYQLTIDDPHRFKKSRLVPAFLGLTPAVDQSGDSDPQRGISKAGDWFLRKLLVQCAHYVLGPFGNDCDLRRWGLRIAERGGKNGRKRAVVAVARKLAVLLHALWISGERYEPLRNAA